VKSDRSTSAADLFHLARPRHWVKNFIVLLPVLFSRRFADAGAWISAGVAAGAFCCASSAVYSLNDLLDRREDRSHPVKRHRPVAAGRLPIRMAASQAAVLSILSLLIGLGANRLVLLSILIYLTLQMAYSTILKHWMLVDVICIALGFVVRAVAGALAIRVPISPWLVVCTFTLCLFLGFCKRRNEIAVLGDNQTAGSHRRTLLNYTPELLTHLITLSGAVAIVSFLLYATSPRTVHNFGTPALVYSLPLVVYGVCRFAMLSMRGAYDDPTDLILRDRPFQATVVLWVVWVVGVVS
jgi:4-hydroxybenzoate polyprenyltransferase